MVRFFFRFEDIQKGKWLETETVEEVLKALIQSVKHVDYHSYYIGQVPKTTGAIYMIVEILEDTTRSRRRGYVEIPPELNITELLPPFVPNEKQSWMRFVRECKDSLFIDGVCGRLSARVPVTADPKVLTWLDELEKIVGQMRPILNKLLTYSEHQLNEKHLETVKEAKQKRLAKKVRGPV